MKLVKLLGNLNHMEQMIWSKIFRNGLSFVTTFVHGFFYAEKEYEAFLDQLENNTATPIDMSALDPDVQDRSKQLYSF